MRSGLTRRLRRPRAALCRAAGGGAGARACPALRWEPRGSAFPCSVSTRPLRREPPTLLITPPNDLAVHEASWGSAPGCPVPPSAGSRAGTPATPGPPRRHRQLPALPPRRMPGGRQRSAVPYRAMGYPQWDGTAGRLSRCCSPPLLPAPCTRPGLSSGGLSASDGERRLQRRCYDLFTLLTAPEFLFPLLSSPQLFKDRSNSYVRTVL